MFVSKVNADPKCLNMQPVRSKITANGWRKKTDLQQTMKQKIIWGCRSLAGQKEMLEE